MPKHHIAGLMTAGLSLFLFPSPAAAGSEATAMEGIWKLHPTFDHVSTMGQYPNHVEKIMDGPRYVFIWANAAPYLSSSPEIFNNPCATLWYIDKEEMPQGSTDFTVHHISELFSTDATGIRYADYNPEGGYLVLFYEPGDLEILHEDGRLIKGLGFSENNLPALRKVRDLVFDNERGLEY